MLRLLKMMSMDYIKLYLATSLGFVVFGFLLYRRGNKIAGGVMIGFITLLWMYNIINGVMANKTA